MLSGLLRFQRNNPLFRNKQRQLAKPADSITRLLQHVRRWLQWHHIELRGLAGTGSRFESFCWYLTNALKFSG